MDEDKRTKIGSTGAMAAARATGDQQPAAAATGTPVPATASNLSTSYLPPQADPLIGQTLASRYAIQKKLGEGGMGAVYLATHTLLDKQVALKVLHGEFARKEDLVERFMQEAKSASRIRHENVIDISDFGTTPEGLVFFAMELLQGHDLHEEIARARLAGELLPWSRSKKIFLQICGALAAAHGQGIIHRDLKPENVYLVEFLGEPDFVKLLDFGIAKLTEVDEGGRKLTKTGMLFGTPEYMSPEQARGENVDHRVDVYAMGCILFQLVTGRVPFEADNFMGVLSLHLTEPAPAIPPEVFDRIGAPRELAAVIDRALFKDRDQRWGTIEELAHAVRRVSGDPLPSDASGAASPLKRAASVPAPATTTQSRQRTQWTGNVAVPLEDDRREIALPPARSKLPLILGAILLVGGAAAAVMFAMGGEKEGESAGSGVASGTAGSGVGSGTGSQVEIAPPDAPPAPPPLPPLPDRVKIRIDSKPRGAEVRDLAGKLYGKTPVNLDVKGAREELTFSLRRRGYADALVALTPDKNIDYLAPLEKGASGGTPTRQVVPVAPKPGTGDGPGSAATVKVPDPTAKPPDPLTRPGPGSAKKPPPDSPDPGDDCDDPPCLKTNVPGLKGFPSESGGAGSE